MIGWTKYFEDYLAHMKLEKNLSDNTSAAYIHDLELLAGFIHSNYGIPPEEVEVQHIEAFMSDLYDRKVSRTTQARVLSGVKSFFNFLVINDVINSLPTELIDSPKTGRKLPDVLTVGETQQIIESVDLSHPQGHRNRAILETLYSCGLRVSELTELRLTDIFLDDGFLRVIGKGDKQRLVPLNNELKRVMKIYLDQRRTLPVDAKHKEFVFLNNKGKKLSRVMIFLIIKDTAAAAGITKQVSPHTFRHSFATHLIQGGADIRVVQEMLGHESIMTTEIYTHLNKEYLKDSVAEHHPLNKMTRS